MSIFRKVPHIEARLGALSEEQLDTFKTIINSTNNGDEYFSLVDNDNLLRTEIGEESSYINAISLQLDKGKEAKSGFVIYNGTWCLFLTYNRFDNVHIYDIDLSNGTYKRVEEECSIDEVRRVVGDLLTGGGEELSPEALVGVLEGSDTIVVDINETDDKVQVRLDQDVSNVIDRALVTPLSAPTDTALVAVGTGREQEQVYIGSGLELGNGTSPYNLNVVGIEETRNGDEFKLWVGTQAQYDAIGSKDNTTIYYIVG